LNCAVDAAEVALRILHLCRQQPLAEIGTVITFSAGVTEACEGDDNDSLLQRCDNALYRAKRTGRNQVLIATRTSVANAEHSAAC
jgi:PleD family two-component response regulator